MSKRFSNSYNGHQFNNSKKPKLDDDEAWEGEELDDEALDKCFELATQAESKNQSILPPYHAFINPTSFASSTQAVNIVSSTRIFKEKELELEVTKLKQSNAEKDGEISILRSRIKDSTVTHQVEQQKTTSEWREKYHSSSKELKTVRSDLDFKNLEIANLKQQLANQRRINLDATVNGQITVLASLPTHQEIRKPSTKDESQSNNSREPILDLISPLKSLSTISFADKDAESHLIKNTKKCYKLSRITIPYLQNQKTCNEINFHHKCPQIDEKPVTLADVYSDILTLVNSRFEKINLESVDKIIAVTLILLKDLNDYLTEFGANLKTEDIQQSDTDYLQRIESNDFELGIQASKILIVVSRLILCNERTADFICHSKLLKLPPRLRQYALLIPHRNGAVESDYYCLKLVLTIVESIGKYRLARQTNDFLIATTTLLKNIASLVNGSSTKKPINDAIFCKLFKEIVFTKPGDEMLEQITFLLKNCAQYKAFINYLFKSDPNKESLMVRSKAKTVLLFNENACCLCVLACQLKNYVIKIEKLPLEVCYNMLSFMYNIVKKSHWVHYENTDSICSCLLQLYRLEIQFLYKGLANFQKYCNEQKNTELLNEWKAFFADQLIQKLLNQINFINYELILKKPSVLGQYKEIEKYLTSEGKFNLVQLNVSDTVPTISHEAINEDF